MDLSTLDILLSLGAIALIAAAGMVVQQRRSARPPTHDDATIPGVGDSGRHHVPKGLLDNPTTRLQPEVLARAREPKP